MAKSLATQSSVASTDHRFGFFAGAPESVIPAAKRISAADNLDGHADVPWFRFRPILYNSYRDVWTCRAFERSFVVISLVRLNAGQPHLRLAEFTKRTTDDPLLGQYLIFSHATPFVWLAWHTHKLKVSIKKSRPVD